MDWQYTDYVWPFLVSVVVAGLLLRYAWPRRDLPATPTFIVLICIAGVWSLLSTLQVLSGSFVAKVILADVRYLAITTLPVAWLFFTLAYSGRQHWLTPYRIAAFLALPALTVGMVATNPMHHLMFEGTTISTQGPITSVARIYGPWFWIQTVYAYGMLALGALVILGENLYGPKLYRKQAILMLTGVVVAVLMNLFFLAAPSRFGHIDLTPVAFTISGVFFAWGLFRAALLDVMPVARAAIIESMPDAVIVLDTQHRVIDLNPAAQQLFDSEGSGAVGQLFSALTPALNLTWTKKELLESHAEEIILSIENEQRHFEYRVSPMTQGHDQTGLVLIVLRDITDRKRAETIESGYQYLLALIAEGHPLSVLLDALTRFIDSLAPGELFSSVLLLREDGTLHHGAAPGLPPDYVLAIDGIEIGPNVGSCGTAAHRGETVIAADIMTDERWADYRTLARSYGLRACWSTPIFSTQREVLGTFALYYRHIRQPSTIELRMIEMASYLAGIAIERRRFETSLFNAQEQANTMTKLKESFLTNMSHEIRTPLTSILGFSDVLMSGAKQDAESLGRLINNAGKRLLATLTALLDYAQLESGALEVKADVLDIAPVAQEAVSLFLPQTEAKGLTLALDMRSPEAHARLDPYMLTRVFTNLLENAVKFTDTGGIVMEVDADAEHVKVNIRDTGRGISKAFLPDIFDEFRQESTGLARSHEGNGLGLPITKRIVEQMHGTIAVESKPGRGSTFAVTFPRYVT